MRYLGIDYGDKRVGLAVCDHGETIVSPLSVVQANSELMEVISDVIDSQGVEAIVLGLPLNMDGTEGAGAKKIRNYLKELEECVDVPVFLHDERLSSFDAESKLAGVGLTRKKKKKHLDAVAAASILQCFLDGKTADKGHDTL